MTTFQMFHAMTGKFDLNKVGGLASPIDISGALSIHA
jgi:hypothetical protein